MENELHKAFADRRVNFVNERREFFSSPRRRCGRCCSRRSADCWSSATTSRRWNTTRVGDAGPTLCTQPPSRRGVRTTRDNGRSGCRWNALT
nr:hypothetical protein [Nocardioides psychrotolerans]